MYKHQTFWTKTASLYFGKVFFQLACRIILGPPKHVLHIPDICYFFSTDTIFGYNFLLTTARKLQQTDFVKNSVNRKKTKLFATKQHKMQQNTLDCAHNEGDFRFLHICHVEKCEINPHVEKI